MPVTLEQIVLDSANALRLAQFYAEVLDREVDPGGTEYFATVGRSGSAPLHPVFMFIQVPEARSGKNRMHVDLVSPDRSTDVARAISAGARHVADFAEYGTAWTTLADPEGNLFDIGVGGGGELSSSRRGTLVAMTGSPDHPRFRALEIGPGGVPADQVHPVRRSIDDPGPEFRLPFDGSGYPATYPHPVTEDAPGPSAVFGSFDTDPTGPSKRAVFGWLALAMVVGVLVAAGLWASGSDPTTTSADIRQGDCLAAASGGSVFAVDCSSPDVEFSVASRYDNSTDSAKCAALQSDLVLVTRDQAVLCLNYRATVGECLFAGNAADVGKAPCRTPGTSSTPPGLFRVVAVLDGTVDPRKCPRGTIESLVHFGSREVLCLGLP